MRTQTLAFQLRQSSAHRPVARAAGDIRLRRAGLLLMAGVLLTVLAGSRLALGQLAGGDYTIAKSTIDGGGAHSTGGEFALTGTIGQPDAGTMQSVDTQYRLFGGFWNGGSVQDFIFEDSFEEP